VFGGIPWQRCQYNLQQNAQAYIPRKSMSKEVAEDIRTIFNTPNRATAEMWLSQTIKKYEHSASRLADWMENNIPEGLTVFSFPRDHQPRIRTANLLERINREIKRCTRVVGIFPNEPACLRLISAFLMEKSEVWSIGHKHVCFEGSEEKVASSPS
jgi:putative transposase